jgi:hypothetical protein
MKIDDIQTNITFYVDALFQKGYDMGWDAVIQELDNLSDREWNMGNKVTAEVIRKVIKEINPEER